VYDLVNPIIQEQIVNGLSRSETEVLETLANLHANKGDGDVIIKDVAGALGKDQSTAGRIINHLAEKQLIRTELGSDSRSTKCILIVDVRDAQSALPHPSKIKI